jgi:peptidoglycan/LPS O-acetylase OafA/YrhL
MGPIPETSPGRAIGAGPQPRAPGRAKTRLEGIDLLRGLAALWVALSHYLPHWNQRGGHALILVPHDWGIYAVELFFVVSGFVIFMTLDKCRSVADFAYLRFSRLYPVYWSTLIAVTAAYDLFFHQKPWLGGVAANLTMFQEFLGYEHFDVVYWSLSVELAFYGIMALLFAFGLHRRPRTIVAVWLALSCAWALFYRAPGPHLPGDPRDKLALFFAFDHAPFFAMGILFYDAARRGWSRSGLALMAAALAAETVINRLPGFCVASAVALIFAAALSGRLGFLVSRATLWLGAVSYSFYLVHRNLGYRTLDLLQDRGMPPALAVPAVLAGALALAAAFHYGVEMPSLEALRRWRERRIGKTLERA